MTEPIQIHVNFNGQILTNQQINTINRAFLYGDSLFDTLLVEKSKLIFSEEHYFRLLAGMRQLRMEIPDYFTQDYWENEIRKVLISNKLETARVRTNIFRDSEGLYTPSKNNVSFLIQVSELNYKKHTPYKIGIYKDNYQSTNTLENIKTGNRLINVLASIYAKENGWDNCLLLNHKKQISSFINGNIFIVFGNQIITPPLSEGCVNGIIRNKIIGIISKNTDFQIDERGISVFELQNADEVFMTNSIAGIQSILEFKNKIYETKTGDFLSEELKKLY